MKYCSLGCICVQACDNLHELYEQHEISNKGERNLQFDNFLQPMIIPKNTVVFAGIIVANWMLKKYFFYE